MKRRLTIQNGQRDRTRGVALLIVLATLVLAISASVTLVRVASTARLREQVQDRVAAVDGLLDAAEGIDGPIQHWLEHDAGQIVLPIDSKSPAVAVLNDHWMDPRSGDRNELRITAFDQLGMVPWRLVRSGSPLRLTLPAEILHVLDQELVERGAEHRLLGLDQWAVREQDSICRFPASLEGDAMSFGDAAGTSNEFWEEGQSSFPAIGGVLATHPSTDALAPAIINVNTAPIPLIQAAMRMAGRDGIEVITAARERGELAPVPAPAPAPRPQAGASSQHDINSAPRFVGDSDSWAFRIDCRVGPLRRSWWAVYQPSAHRTSSRAKPWECVQRLAITE